VHPVADDRVGEPREAIGVEGEIGPERRREGRIDAAKRGMLDGCLR
jgi:hypothetical protein